MAWEKQVDLGVYRIEAIHVWFSEYQDEEE
jgi:hypothetical protein